MSAHVASTPFYFDTAPCAARNDIVRRWHYSDDDAQNWDSAAAAAATSSD